MKQIQSLKDVLQRRQVDDGELPEDGESDGDDKELVGGEAHFGQDEALLNIEHM